MGGEVVNYPALRHGVHIYQALREKLLADFPDADHDTIRDSLEGATSLHELVAGLIRSALVDEALQTGLRARLDDMKSRLARLEERGARKRQLALEAMSDVGLHKIEECDFTVSTRSGSPGLVIVSEENIPANYWVPQPPKLDRQRVLTELKQGSDIQGVHLSNPKPTLLVRTK
jgi:hypothetical protein